MQAQAEIGEWTSVNGYPTLRFYINGLEVDYSGPRESAEILKFMDSAIDAKLPTVNTINDLKKPAVAVFGIKEDSPLQLLTLKFSRFPIYHVLEESEFKVEVH